MDIKKEVDYIVKKHGTSCPFKIAAAKGIIVLFEPLGSILGYYSKSHRTQVIHINESAAEHQQEFACGHELGHAILHPDSNTPFLDKHTLFSTERIEIEAHTFAIELIFTNKKIVTFQDAKSYGIPYQLALLKSLNR
ncbi:ImmA/IrrE family metallo-endopeptidase [Halalkalibacter oceani]|uniref:ImmA/IrrE family metallo-endopeptidase n=1 Tax=Halalkalibacter oceani TaxID=1653776 RepID=UPI00339A6A4B